jgi:polyphosphate kinase
MTISGALRSGRVRRSETVEILSFHPREDAHDGLPRVLNRELSWLQFNERVLGLAEDPATPLLERARFLAIFTSNLDEFFQVRVAGLREQVAAGVQGDNADGLSPTAQLAAIRTITRRLALRQARILSDQLVPALRSAGIAIVDVGDLDRGEHREIEVLFEERIYPVLTPLAVDPAHPFPIISSLSLNLAVILRNDDGEERFARVKIPPILPRLVPVSGGSRYVPLESIVATHLGRLFPGVDVLAHHTFRVTRNADFEIEEDEADDLLLAIRSELSRRRFGRAVRLEVETAMSPDVLELLKRELELDDDEVDVLPAPLGLDGLAALVNIDRPDLTWPAFSPLTPPEFTAPPVTPDTVANVFDVLRERDVLLHHPYDAFATSVQAFIEQAAHDPQVLAIKITLYRTSGPGSPIIRALLDAAEAGKQVVALVELKARFDEEANIVWANQLEEAGVHVAYGVVGLKIHTKIALVVRDEGDTVRCYVHIGTGNYNDLTARVYEDLGLLSARPELGADLSDLFNVLTGYARRQQYRRLVTAPTGFRRHIAAMIEREAQAEDGHIMLKVNALVDPEMIEALYAASNRGTRVDLLVRGVCCLRPGVAGMSENIRVRSVVGRYLEHSRIYRFGSVARGFDHLIGSGDLMPRNLDRRIEALVPIDDPALAARLEEVLQIAWEDDMLAWELGRDSRWRRLAPEHGNDAHITLQKRARERAATSPRPWA